MFATSLLAVTVVNTIFKTPIDNYIYWACVWLFGIYVGFFLYGKVLICLNKQGHKSEIADRNDELSLSEKNTQNNPLI